MLPADSAVAGVAVVVFECYVYLAAGAAREINFPLEKVLSRAEERWGVPRFANVSDARVSLRTFAAILTRVSSASRLILPRMRSDTRG